MAFAKVAGSDLAPEIHKHLHQVGSRGPEKARECAILGIRVCLKFHSCLDYSQEDGNTGWNRRSTRHKRETQKGEREYYVNCRKVKKK